MTTRPCVVRALMVTALVASVTAPAGAFDITPAVAHLEKLAKK
jgi:hypothetical protein